MTKEAMAGETLTIHTLLPQRQHVLFSLNTQDLYGKNRAFIRAHQGWALALFFTAQPQIKIYWSLKACL